jgi:methanogenic corrinoid protein MtbC1
MARLIDAGVPATQAAQAALTTADLPRARQARDHEIDPAVARLLEHARTLDALSLRNELRQAFGASPAADAIERVAMPFARAMGDLWESGTVTMVYEHFASEMLRAEMVARIASAVPAATPTPAVVLGCPALERHDLGNVALWLVLAERGVNVVYLGVDLPIAELVAACKQLAPAAICLTATATTTLPTLSLAVRALIEAKVPGKVYVGGPALAAEREDRPVAGIHLPQSIVAAADVIAADLRGPR